MISKAVQVYFELMKTHFSVFIAEDKKKSTEIAIFDIFDKTQK